MELAEFYGAVLPPTGAYALFHAKSESHHWCDTIEELVALTEKHSNEQGWYYGTASFGGKRRKQSNVIAKKAFYVDIDAGPEKFEKHPAGAWPTKREAALALLSFAEQIALPPSIVIDSGGGLHAYWCLSEVLDGTRWTQIAETFKAAARNAGLRADPACTADSARVLRPPGTTAKDGARVRQIAGKGQLYSVGDLLEGIARVAPQYAESVGRASDQLPDDPTIVAAASVNDDFKHFEPVPTSARKVAASCNAVAQVAASRGDVPEPHWRAMISIVKHCIEGEPLVHEWSKGYAGYDERETHEKYERYTAGPATCAHFGDHAPYACETCEFRGKIKSPIVLGRISEELKHEVPNVLKDEPETKVKGDDNCLGLPDEVLGPNYRVEMFGGRPTLYGQQIKFIKSPLTGETTRNASWLKFTHDIFWLTGWTEAGRLDTETSTMSWTLLRRGKTHDFDLQAEISADRKALLKYLAGKTISPVSHEPDVTAMMQQYVNDQIRRVKDAISRPVIRGHLGFHMAENRDLFCAQGEHVIYRDGVIRKANLGHGLDHVREGFFIEPLPNKGELSWGPAVWEEIAMAAKRQTVFFREWFGKEGLEVAQFAIMLQLASPLMVFAAVSDMQPGQPLPGIGLTVSLYSSESAKGKTSIQYAAGYAFGDASQIVRQGDRLGMTFNAQVATAASLGTLPFQMDEVTTNDKAQVGESINRISSGVEKVRGTKDGSVSHAPQRWALISTVSTNIPQRELISEFQKGSDALQMRLIELNCDRLPTRPLNKVPEYDEALRVTMDGTKGSLGAMIHLYCCSKGYDEMRRRVLAKCDYVARKSPGESKERFILRGVASMLVLQEILTELHLRLFSTDVLESEVDAAFGSVRGHTLDSKQHFMRMVRELAPHVLITADDIPVGDEYTLLENEHAVRAPYAGRLCRKTNTLYLAVDACKAWCVENQLSPAAVMEDARKQGLIIPFAPMRDVGQIVMTKGIRTVWLPKQHVYRCNASALRVIDVITEAANVTPLTKATADQSPGHALAGGRSS